MSLPTFCSICGNLTGVINILNGRSTCPICGTITNLSKDNRIISKDYHNTGNRIMTDIEITRLTTEATTQKIKKQCTKCDNDILSLVFDDSYKRITTSCGKCGTIYN